jgi:hypothetical protein
MDGSCLYTRSAVRPSTSKDGFRRNPCLPTELKRLNQ